MSGTHHLAMCLSVAVPLCGRDDGEGLSLDADKVKCEECRRIAELGPLPEPEEDDGIECPNCTPFDREDCDYPEGH